MKRDRNKNAIRGIYAIVNLVNDHKYIGRSVNILKRVKSHFKLLNENKHKNKSLQGAYNTYGKENFIFMILSECPNYTNDKLNELEKLFIGFCNTHINIGKLGYNYTLGGENFEGYKMSPEAIEKSVSKRRGRKTSDETKKKLSDALKGRKFSEEHSRKKSEAQMGGKNPMARKCCVNGIIYNTVIEAARAHNLKGSTAGARLNSKTSFKDWYYINEENSDK